MARRLSQTTNSVRRRRSKRINSIQTLNNKCAVINNSDLEKFQTHDVSLREDALLKINNSVDYYSFDSEDEECKLKLDLSNTEEDESITVCNKRKSQRIKTRTDKQALKRKTPSDKPTMKQKIPSDMPTLKRKLPTDKHVQKTDKSLKSKKRKLDTMPIVGSKIQKTIPQMQRKMASKSREKKNVSSQNISRKAVTSTPSSSIRSHQLDPASKVNGKTNNTASQHKERKVTPKTTKKQGVALLNSSENAMTSTPSLSRCQISKNVEPELSPVRYLEEVQPHHGSPLKTVQTLTATLTEKKTSEPLADKPLVSPIQRLVSSDADHLFGFGNSESECVDSKEENLFQATDENTDPFRPLDISKTYCNHSIGFYAQSIEKKKKRKKHIAKSKRYSSGHYDALASKMNQEFEELDTFELSIA